MYTEYFGLREPPFSLTPDPHFLYLSARHREALAHLRFGVEQGGGFVQLTGEVGTGKTTLCRSLLEQLGDCVDAALILSPRLSACELLASICAELGVDVDARAHSPKGLVDALNEYLLRVHADGRNTVVIIDEAQNLSPDVLEQVRLLTNLETAKHKLLQVILVGQPELRTLLGRNDLRQLAQRITARYHLMPLNRAETAAYIRHRLAVSGAWRALFTPRAQGRVHRVSGGVPRLINAVCDRAMLGAYAREEQQVGVRLVRRAAAEVLGDTRPRRVWRRWIAAAVGALGLAVLAGGWFHGHMSLPMYLQGRHASRSPDLIADSYDAVPARLLAATSCAVRRPTSPTAAGDCHGYGDDGPIRKPLMRGAPILTATRTPAVAWLRWEVGRDADRV